MIYCKKYKMSMSSDRICVYNQKKIADCIEKKKDSKTKKTECNQILVETMDVDFFKIRKCVGCKFGERAYSRAKKENRLPCTRWKDRRLTKKQHKDIALGRKKYQAMLSIRSGE